MCAVLEYYKKNYENSLSTQNSQFVKNGVALKSLGEKSYEIKGGSQEMAAMMLMLINFNNAHSHY